MNYVFGQAVTAYVGIKLPSDYVNTYRDLKSYELYLYLFVAGAERSAAENCTGKQPDAGCGKNSQNVG